MDSNSNTRNYLISKHTFLLESKANGKNLMTVVHDKRGKYEIPISPLRLIKKSCALYGRNYNSSLEESKELLNLIQRKKLPLVVGNDFGKPLIVFPLFSPSSKHNIWIVYNNVLSLSTLEDEVGVIFQNMDKVLLPVKKNTLIQQMASSLVLYTLTTRQWDNRQLLF